MRFFASCIALPYQKTCSRTAGKICVYAEIEFPLCPVFEDTEGKKPLPHQNQAALRNEPVTPPIEKTAFLLYVSERSNKGVRQNDSKMSCDERLFCAHWSTDSIAEVPVQ